ncbi:Ig-like domain (group 2) [Singulisphaera sp. GP187]|uniref:Ig-like domain-containing protein n=1 Tax=Singulisphaera sp. GP187 TaxID=1882752 RepID=UPI0009286D1B|nr:Ig-like domain-containing protein [Singulisphaera sp. GP187]SIO59718.1 Ig-like domain (group 2) [Singulisphaera sp. GP187]
MTILARALLRADGAWGRRAKRHRTTRFRPLLGLELLEDRKLLATTSVATFESFGLAPNTYVNNAGPSGKFVDAGNTFNTEFSPDFGGLWSGWAISSTTDTTTPGYTNQYSAITGSGADGSQTYGVAFTFGGAADPFHPAGSFVNLPDGATPVSIEVTNTTYAYLSMLNGDTFVSAFGAGDFLRLTIEGYTGPNGTGTKIGEVDFDLANFLGSNHSIINTWQTVGLTPLSGAGSLQFGLESSRNDPLYGINTPAFFAVDNLTVSTPSGAVGGVVFNDLDGDGSQDSGEGGLQGWVVELYSGATLVATSSPTDGGGHYSIPNVAPGNYTLRQVPQGGFSQTLPIAPGVYQVTITDGGSLTGLDFGNAPLTLTKIMVTPANPSLAKGLSQQFIATGTYSDQSTRDLTTQVIWASSTQATATINAGGLATGAGLGTTTITATLGNVVGTTDLTVTAPVVVSIAVTPANPSLAKGLGQQFTATGTYSDQTTQDLTGQVVWVSGTPLTAVITSGGLATGAALGTSTITAMLSGVSGSSILTVTAPVVVSIAVTPAAPSLAKGLSQQFTAMGTYSDQSTQDLTGQVAWTSGTPSIATITAGGLAGGANLGASTIRATLGGVSGTTDLTVTAPVVVSIAVTPAAPSLAKGLSQQFTATGTYSDQSMQDLTSQVVWASSTQATATITSGGLARGAALGTATITATLGSASGTTNLTVTAPVVVSIAVTPAAPSLAKGLSQQFTATGTYSDQTTQDVTGLVVWASSPQTTATITSGGLARGAALGTATITATLGSVIGTTELTVTAPVVVSIAVTPATPSLAKGSSQQFTATGTYSDQTTQDLTGLVAWVSGTPSTVVITSGGLATGAALGTSTITAMLSGVSGSSVLTVTAPVVVSIAVTPTGQSVAKGLSQQFIATGIYSDQSTRDLTAQVIWASSTLATATINAGGLATGAGLGTTTITATLGNVIGTSNLTVTAARLVTIVVDPQDASLEMGQTSQLAAVGVYSDGSTRNLTGQVAWVSANHSVATISNSGLASGVTAGTATVTAALNGVRGTAALRVTPTATPVPNQTSPVTLTSLRVERVNLGATRRLRNVKALVAGFSGPLSETAAQNLAAYAVSSGRLIRAIGGPRIVFDGRVTLTRALYDAPQNRVILIPVRPARLPRIEHLRVDVSRLTDPQDRPINNGRNFEAVATPRGLLGSPSASQVALSAAAVDAL